MNVVPPFKDALLELLIANTAVSALVGERVYDEAPEDDRGDSADVVYPYVYLGPVGVTRQDEGPCGVGWQVRVRIYAASNAFGRNQVWALIGAVYSAVEGATLTLPAGNQMSPSMWVLQGGDVIDPVNPKMAFLDLTTVIAGQ